MIAMDYLDFELEIVPGRGRNYPVTVVRSPAGEARETMRFPYSQAELDTRLESLENALFRASGRRRRIPSTREQPVHEFGSALFKALMTGSVLRRYEQSLQLARRQSKGLRLKLRIQAADLAALPWEFIHDQERGYVALSRNTPIVRYLDLGQPTEPLMVDPPLRILGMVANPSHPDLDELETDHEKQRLEAALAGLQAEGRVDLTWLPGETWRDLLRAMRVGPWHIFHFIGHGGFDEVAEEGVIALSGDRGELFQLRATQLAPLLSNHYPLRLAFLNACEGARSAAGDVVSSTAATLVQRGVPAVLAMQYEISDRAAIEFSRSFYEGIASGVPVDTAVAEARLAVNLAGNNSLEWGTPVLFMRSPDGRIFEVETSEQERADHEPDSSAFIWTEKETHVRPDNVHRLEVRRVLAAIDRHVRSVAISPDGRLVAAGSDDCTVGLWQVEDGKLLQTLEEHTDWVMGVAFSPDGQIVASASDDFTIRLWRVVDGTVLRILTGHAGVVTSVAFSPDGQLVATGSADKTVRLWNVADGTPQRSLGGHTDSVRSVAFSPDGRRVASGSADSTVRLWRVEDGKLLQTLEGHTEWVAGVAFSPDGKIVASAGDFTVRLWRVADGAPLQRLAGHTNWALSVAFSPDGQIVASGSADYMVRLWRVADGIPLQRLAGHTEWVRSVCFAPNGRFIVSGSDDYTVRLWQVEDETLQRPLVAHTGFVNGVAFSPDGRLVASGSADKTVRLWQVDDGMLLRTLEGHTERVRSVAFSPDGRLVASGSVDKTVRLWQVDDGMLLRTLEGHTERVFGVAFSPDGRLVASGSVDKTVRLWQVDNGMLLRTLDGHASVVRSVAFSPDGRLVASGSDDFTVRLWQVEDGKLLQTLEGHTDWVTSVAFSPDGQVVASASDDFTIRLWRIHEG
jgi:WD40 repeat protein